MKPRYVPGPDCLEHPLDEQADVLRKKLVGHQIFARMRGKVAGYAMWTLLDEESKQSPTASLRVYDAYVRDLRVMRNLVVWLRWHGYRRAAEEVFHALEDGEYRIWCEEVSFSESVPGTVLMFRPLETLRLCRWWAGVGNNDLRTCYYNSVMENRDSNFVPKQIDPETDVLRNLYNELTNAYLSCEPSKIVFNSIMKERINNPIIRDANSAGKKEFDECEMNFCGKNYPLYAGSVVAVNERRDAYQGGAFAYFFPNKGQDEVLSWFPRGIQGKLAAWYLRIPKQNLCGVVQLDIGLFPEDEYRLWEELYPAMVSKGVDSGLGALLSPRDEFPKDALHIRLKSW